MRKKYVSDSSNTIHIHSEKSDHGLHPTQKPVELLEALIELTTQENQIVLDPFCGSGSTLVAAKNLGRKFVGIEKDANFFAVAQKRVNDFVQTENSENLAFDLFGEKLRA